ncbi:MAG TPA: hypothetical protein PKV55_16495, partial [Nitrospira sp.]|nr:hypothetical protein [Nitrospira sp.]
HADDGADSDDDAEHGQACSQWIPAEDAEGRKNRQPEKAHIWFVTVVPVRTPLRRELFWGQSSAVVIPAMVASLSHM